MPKNYCIMQIWAESGKSALPICNYSQILYQFLTFTQNLKRSRGIGVRAITMTAKTAPANAAAPITAAVFLLRFFFTALQISMAQTTQTAAAASAITSVSHNHKSSYNILIRSPYLSLANWDLIISFFRNQDSNRS